MTSYTAFHTIQRIPRRKGIVIRIIIIKRRLIWPQM